MKERGRERERERERKKEIEKEREPFPLPPNLLSSFSWLHWYVLCFERELVKAIQASSKSHSYPMSMRSNGTGAASHLQ